MATISDSSTRPFKSSLLNFFKVTKVFLCFSKGSINIRSECKILVAVDDVPYQQSSRQMVRVGAFEGRSGHGCAYRDHGWPVHTGHRVGDATHINFFLTPSSHEMNKFWDPVTKEVTEKLILATTCVEMRRIK